MQATEKTGPSSGMASRHHLLCLDEQGIFVAVEIDLAYALDMARLLPFSPDALLRSTVKMGEAGLDGQPQRLLAHIGQHQDLTILRILHNGRDQSRFIEPKLSEVESFHSPLIPHRDTPTTQVGPRILDGAFAEVKNRGRQCSIGPSF